MKFLRHCIVIAGAALLASGSAVAQTTVADVKYEEAASVQGKLLLLNGAGIRYKAVFKVYTAGLYLEKKAPTPQDVLALKGPKRMRIVMLREIDSAELGKLFSRGMEDNIDSFGSMDFGISLPE